MTEGHIGDALVSEYCQIISHPPEEYGDVEGHRYRIPPDLVGSDTNGANMHLRPMMALVGPKSVLYFADHQAFLQLTVGRLDRPLSALDLTKGSQVSYIKYVRNICSRIQSALAAPLGSQPWP